MLVRRYLGILFHPQKSNLKDVAMFDEYDVLPMDGVQQRQASAPMTRFGAQVNYLPPFVTVAAERENNGAIYFYDSNYNQAHRFVAASGSLLAYDNIGDLDQNGEDDYLFCNYADSTASIVYGPLIGNYSLPEDASFSIQGAANSYFCASAAGATNSDGSTNIIVGELTGPGKIYDIHFSNSVNHTNMTDWSLPTPPAGVTVTEVATGSDTASQLGLKLRHAGRYQNENAFAFSSTDAGGVGVTRRGKWQLYTPGSGIFHELIDADVNTGFEESFDYVLNDMGDNFYAVGLPNAEQIQIYKNTNSSIYQTINSTISNSDFGAALTGNFTARNGDPGLLVGAPRAEAAFLYTYDGIQFIPEQALYYERDTALNTNFAADIAVTPTDLVFGTKITNNDPGFITAVPALTTYFKKRGDSVCSEDEFCAFGDAITVSSQQSSLNIAIAANSSTSLTLQPSANYSGGLAYIYDVNSNVYRTTPNSSASEINALLAETQLIVPQDYHGHAEFDFTSNDGVNIPATRHLNLNINAVDDFPRFQPVANLTAVLNDAYRFSNFSIENPDGALSELRYQPINMSIWLDDSISNDLPVISGIPVTVGDFSFAFDIINTRSGLSTQMPVPLHVIYPNVPPAQVDVIPTQNIETGASAMTLDAAEYYDHPYYPNNIYFLEDDFPRDDILLSADGLFTLPPQPDVGNWWAVAFDSPPSYDAETISFQVCVNDENCINESFRLTTTQAPRSSTQKAVANSIMFGLPSFIVLTAWSVFFHKKLWPKVKKTSLGKRIAFWEHDDDDDDVEMNPVNPPANAQAWQATQPSNKPTWNAGQVPNNASANQPPAQNPTNPNTVNLMTKLVVNYLGMSQQNSLFDLKDIWHDLINADIFSPIYEAVHKCHSDLQEQDAKKQQQFSDGINTIAQWLLAARKPGQDEDISLMLVCHATAFQNQKAEAILQIARLAEIKSTLPLLEKARDSLTKDDKLKLYLLAILLGDAIKKAVNSLSLENIQNNREAIVDSFIAECLRITAMDRQQMLAWQSALFKTALLDHLRNGIKTPESAIKSVTICDNNALNDFIKRIAGYEIISSQDLLKLAICIGNDLADMIEAGECDAKQTSWWQGNYQLDITDIAITQFDDFIPQRNNSHTQEVEKLVNETTQRFSQVQNQTSFFHVKPARKDKVVISFPAEQPRMIAVT